MSRLFISHSSKNDDWAIALKDWLVGEGWSGETDIFLDFDPERGIVAGQLWVKALEDAATRCEAVLFLVSEDWLASRWCHDEYQLADKYGKKLFALLIDPIPVERLPGGLKARWQIVSLRGEPARRFLTEHPYTRHQSPVHIVEAGLTSLKRGLEKAGIGAETFDLAPDPAGPLGWRAVYRGLEALEPEDAAVFFGRNADIVRGIDALRSLAARKAPRLLVVLGASGAGKSSFLRAGLWPRLLRDDSQWLPLRAIRAGRGGAIEGSEGLLAALEDVHRRFALPASRFDLRKSLATPEAFVALLGTLRQAAARRALIGVPPFPLPILCLDQGEEVFAADAGPEGATLLRLARAAIDADAALLLVTIRSDSYGLMQGAGALAGIDQQPLSLGPVPQGEIARVIREPAELLRRKAGPAAPLFDPAVVARLQAEIEGEADALPLLAFVLQRLMREHAGASVIGIAELEATGGVAEAIESEAEAALADAGFSPDRAERRDALRRLFIPRLARIDRETKATQRRVSPHGDLPTDLLPLAKALTARRLLVTKLATATEGDTARADDATLEVAHEALLRRWPTLVDLLAEDRDALLLLDGLLNAAFDWGKAEEATKADYVAHRGSRLAEAETLAARGGNWTNELLQARDYMVACQIREADERAEKEAALAREKSRFEEKKKAQRKTAWALAVIAILLLGGVAAVLLQRSANFALQESLEENRQSLQHQRANVLGNLAHIVYTNGDVDSGLRFATLGGKIDSLLSSKLAGGSPAEVELSLIASRTANRAVLSGHEKALLSAAFSPDGARVVTASLDETARLWDASTGQALAVLRGHKGYVNSAAFSPDGRRIVTASADETARLWDALTGDQIATLNGHNGEVQSAVFSPDGKRIVTVADDARLWDADTEKPVAVLSGGGFMFFASFDHEGARVLTPSWENAISLWESKTGKLITVFKGHEGIVYSAVFSRDGKRVVTASADCTARIWDASTGGLLAILRGHEGGVQSAAFSSDGRLIVTASLDKTARLWDASTGRLIAVLRGHEGAVSSAAFSPNDRLVVTASEDKTARLWDVTTRMTVAVLRGHNDSVVSAVFSLDGQRIATASQDKTARVWDAKIGQEVATLDGHVVTASAAAFRPDGEYIVTATDKDARVWEAKTGQSVAVLRGHEGVIYSTAYNYDGRLIITASFDKTARVWDPAKSSALLTLVGHTDAVNQAAFSPDGSRALTASEDKTARLWNASTGQVIAVLAGHEDAVYSAAFSRDGALIVTSSRDGTTRLWTGTTGQLIAVLRGPQGVVQMPSVFSPDGSLIATSAGDDNLYLWSAKGQLIATFRGHENIIQSAAFSPNGMSLLTASQDKTARLWSIADGRQMAILRGHDDMIWGADFDFDGQRIVTASFDGTARVWDASTARAIMVVQVGAKLLSASFSPDGKQMMTVEDGGAASIWDVHLATMSTKDLLAEVCTHRLHGISTMTRDEMRLAGYPDSEPLIDVCASVH